MTSKRYTRGDKKKEIIDDHFEFLEMVDFSYFPPTQKVKTISIPSSPPLLKPTVFGVQKISCQSILLCGTTLPTQVNFSLVPPVMAQMVPWGAMIGPLAFGAGA